MANFDTKIKPQCAWQCGFLVPAPFSFQRSAKLLGVMSSLPRATGTSTDECHSKYALFKKFRYFYAEVIAALF